MTHFLDESPFSLLHPGARELRDLLAREFRVASDVMALCDEAGVPAEDILWSQPGRSLWYDVLRTARRQSTRSAPVLRRLIERCAARSPSLGERLFELLADRPVLPATAAVGGPVELAASAGEVERLLGERSTLVDVAWLERGAEVAKAVGRVLVSRGEQRTYGTGFLVGERRVLTNRHVVDGAQEDGAGLELWLSYELDPRGQPRAPNVLRADPRSIHLSPDPALDWATFELAAAPAAEYPRLGLRPATPVRAGDSVAIVQHAGGRRKSVGVLTNLVVARVRATIEGTLQDAYLQYLTDTETGSSGAPVFNADWEVVALHYSWHERADAAAGEPRIVNQGVLIEHVCRAIERAP